MPPHALSTPRLSLLGTIAIIAAILTSCALCTQAHYPPPPPLRAQNGSPASPIEPSDRAPQSPSSPLSPLSPSPPQYLLNADAFVRRQGSQLILDGKPFRFAGANIYWLGLDENFPPGTIAYPTPFRVHDALATARLMGANVVRCHTCGVSTGNPLSYEARLNAFNQSAIEVIDVAVAEAAAQGIRLVVPLTDNYRYFHGGKHDFTDWRGISDENEFYTNPTVIADFYNYVRAVLTHVNVHTRIALADDPTILAWETGNELQSPTNWTLDVAKFIKSIDANHLVLDGHFGLNPGVVADASGAVDIVSDHYYPSGNVAQMERDAVQAAANDKVFLVGEFGWTQGDLPSFLSAVESNKNVSGDLFWSLFGHADTYGYVQHGDTFTLHYPGDTADMQERAAQLRAHAFLMSQGLSPPPTPPAPPAPTITMAAAASGQVAWRGSVGAGLYTVQRSVDRSSWTTVCNGCVNDNQLPWRDATAGGQPQWYRVAAASTAGLLGPYSDPVRSS